MSIYKIITRPKGASFRLDFQNDPSNSTSQPDHTRKLGIWKVPPQLLVPGSQYLGYIQGIGH